MQGSHPEPSGVRRNVVMTYVYVLAHPPHACSCTSPSVYMYTLKARIQRGASFDEGFYPPTESHTALESRGPAPCSCSRAAADQSKP